MQNDVGTKSSANVALHIEKQSAVCGMLGGCISVSNVRVTGVV